MYEQLTLDLNLDIIEEKPTIERTQSFTCVCRTVVSRQHSSNRRFPRDSQTKSASRNAGSSNSTHSKFNLLGCRLAKTEFNFTGE